MNTNTIVKIEKSGNRFKAFDRDGNKLTSEIKNLIDQKHRVLLDVSHELKTPLTRMRLMVEMLKIFL